MVITGVQINPVWENPEATFLQVASLLDRIPPERGSLLVFPELTACGFSMNVDVVAEERGGPSERFFSDLAARLACGVVAGIPGRDEAGQAVNEAVVFDSEGKEISRYRKTHLFTYAHEPQFYHPGEEVVLFEWQGWRVAPVICYDLRFPELFRAAVTQGAEVFVVIANWPTPRVEHWITLLRARAIENQAYVVGVNRCGHDPALPYPGHSIVVDPKGTVIAQAAGEEEVITATLDRAALLAWREQFPALNDLKRW